MTKPPEWSFINNLIRLYCHVIIIIHQVTKKIDYNLLKLIIIIMDLKILKIIDCNLPGWVMKVNYMD